MTFSFSGERSNWNVEDDIESAVRPPSVQEASVRQCNGLSEDSSSETSSYSENSRTTTVKKKNRHSRLYFCNEN